MCRGAPVSYRLKLNLSVPVPDTSDDPESKTREHHKQSSGREWFYVQPDLSLSALPVQSCRCCNGVVGLSPNEELEEAGNNNSFRYRQPPTPSLWRNQDCLETLPVQLVFL